MHRIHRLILATLLAVASGLAVAAEPVDINAADAATLTALNGIGQARAQAIVEHRSEHGPFRSAEALAEVSGISLNLVERNRDRITVGEQAGDETPAGE